MSDPRFAQLRNLLFDIYDNCDYVKQGGKIVKALVLAQQLESEYDQPKASQEKQ